MDSMKNSLSSSTGSFTAREPGVPLWRTIKAKGAIPSPRSGHSAVIYRHNMFIFGGRDGNTFKNDVFSFNFSTSKWVEIVAHGSRPVQRYGHRAVVYDGKMVVFGGHAANSYLNDLLELNFDTYEWKIVEGGGQAPTPRWQHSMVVWRGELLIFGGCDSTSFLNDFYAFNFEHRLWRNILIDEYSIPPTPRMQHGAVIAGDKLYVYGGQSGDTVKSDLYEFNFELSTWSFIGVYEDFHRRNFACIEYHGNIIIMGGYSGGLRNDVLQFNPETGAWSELLKVEGKPPSKRSGHSGELYGDKMIVFGGLANEGSQNDLFELDLGTMDDETNDQEADHIFSPPVLPSMLGSSPIEVGFLHRLRGGYSERDLFYPHNSKDENPMMTLYREEIQKLREEMDELRRENLELKREVKMLKAEKAELSEESQYFLM